MLGALHILTVGVLLPECSLLKSTYKNSDCCDANVSNVDVFEYMAFDYNMVTRAGGDNYIDGKRIATKAVCTDTYEEFVRVQRTPYMATCSMTGALLAAYVESKGYPPSYFGFETTDHMVSSICLRQLGMCMPRGTTYGLSVRETFGLDLSLGDVAIDKISCSNSMINTDATINSAIAPSNFSTLEVQYDMMCNGRTDGRRYAPICVTRQGIKTCYAVDP